MFLLLAQWDLFVLKPEAAAPGSRAAAVALLSMFPGMAVKQAHLAVALISCCSFCFIFSHLIDWVVPSQKALHSNGFLLSLQAGAFYIFSLPYPLYSSRKYNYNCSNPTPFVSQMRSTVNFCIKAVTLSPHLLFLGCFPPPPVLH